MSKNKEKEALETTIKMFKAYRNGNRDLHGFPESIEKQSILSLFGRGDKLKPLNVDDLKSKLDSSENEEDQIKIILDVIDNYKVNPETQRVLSQYEELLIKIRNKNNS